MGVLDNDYAVMVGAPSTFRDVAEQKIQNFTLQQAADQQQIADLQQKLTDASSAITADEQQIADLKAQISALQNSVAYRSMEYGIWQMNTKPDAASGRGNATLTPADNPNAPALFSIVPDPPLPGDKDNFFNAYATQKKKPDWTVTKFVLRGRFDFPTDTDMKNAHCIEFEGRQVLKILAPATLPLMAVPALQCNFSSNMFRYFNALAPGDNWIPTGVPMPRQRTVAVVMEAHRDEKTLFYDAFTINGQRHAVSFQAPLYAKTYVNERLSVSLQLDSHYLGGAFKVIPSGLDLEVS